MIDLPSPCLVVLVGVPGSGKSTWAATHLAEHTVSSDRMRGLVGEHDGDLRASADAFAVLDDIVDRRLRRGLTTVIDSLGTDPSRRAAWRSLAERHRVPCVAVVFDVAAATARRNNAARPVRVPDPVLRQQLKAWPDVVAAVRVEPFAAVHDADVPALVTPSMVRRGPAGRGGGSGSAAAEATVRQTPTPSAGAALQFSVQVPSFTWPGGPAEIGARLATIAADAERAGFDGLWVMDHMLQIPMFGPPWADMLESWTTLAYLAGRTSTLRLGTLVTAVTMRNVAHLAKIVATLDVLSGGRALFGIGLGGNEPEHRAYGWPYPTRNERYDLLADALELLPSMWGPGSKPYTGRVLTVPDTSCYPRPLQARIPILVGGSGERRTLRLVARAADACNLFGEPDVVARRVAALRSHCRDVDRDPAEISITHLSTALVGEAATLARLVDAVRPPRMSAERFRRSVNAGTAAHHRERIERLVEAGVDHVIVSLPDAEVSGAIERWADVVAPLRN